VSPNMVQAVAQTRIDDFIRTADQRRRFSEASAPRGKASNASRMSKIRSRRRFRLGLA
jgi:hypothetical protein